MRQVDGWHSVPGPTMSKTCFFSAYPLGRTSDPPGRNAELRARNTAFFNKMYGDCQAAGVAS